MNFNDYPALRPLLEKARVLRGLDLLLQDALPPDLRRHCSVVNLRDGIVIVGCDSSSTAFRARYLETTLLSVLAEHCPLALEGLRVRVIQAESRETPPPRRLRGLSEENAQYMSDAADYVGDERLRAAMKRLARHRRQEPQT